MRTVKVTIYYGWYEGDLHRWDDDYVVDVLAEDEDQACERALKMFDADEDMNDITLAFRGIQHYEFAQLEEV